MAMNRTEQRTLARLVPLIMPMLPLVSAENKLKLFRELQREYPGNSSIIEVIRSTWRRRVSLMN